MTTEESKRVLTLLEQSIRSSRVSLREIERQLEVGQGYLNSIFKGRIQLRVSHVYAIAQVLGVEPVSLFFGATPPKDPTWLLQQLGLDPSKQKPPAALLAYLQALPVDREELRQMIREELASLVKPPDPEDEDDEQS